MPSTTEHRGLNWINNLNMTTFGSLISNLCWLVGSFAFTWLVCYLTTRQDFYDAVGAIVEGTKVRQMVMVTRETTRQLGLQIAWALMAAWTGKTVAGVVDAQQKRKAAKEYGDVIAAEAEGKVKGAAAVALAAEKVKDAAVARQSGLYERPPTKEHPVPPLKQEVNVNVGEATTTVEPTLPVVNPDREAHDADV